MVEISADHFKDPMRGGISPLEKATVFSFGRQCGHTEAIKEYVSQSEEEMLVVCHNLYAANDMNNELGFNAAVSIGSIVKLERFRGCTPNPVKIIFDSCTIEQIKLFISEAMLHMAYDIKAITIVQPVF